MQKKLHANYVLLVHTLFYSDTWRAQLTRIPLSVTDAALFVLTIVNSVDELADTKNDDVGDKLTEFGKCQEGKAEPQAEHSSEI